MSHLSTLAGGCGVTTPLAANEVQGAGGAAPHNRTI